MSLPWRNRWAGAFEALTLVGIVLVAIVFALVFLGARAAR